MTLIVDVGTLFAQADADDPEHEAVVTLFEGERGPLITSGGGARPGASLPGS